MTTSRSFQHPTLGVFLYEEAPDWYACTLPGGVTVSVLPDEKGEPAASPLLDQIAEDLPALSRGAADHATGALIALKNGEWLGDDEEAFSPEAFRAKLTLEGIVVDRDGAEFYFEDGDLFWGHTVVVEMDTSGVYSEAYIAG